jgi:hypothetical protein
MVKNKMEKNRVITIRETGIQGIFYTTTRKYYKFIKELRKPNREQQPLFEERILDLIIKLSNINKQRSNNFKTEEEFEMMKRYI